MALFVLDTMGSYFKVFMMVFSIVALVYSRHYLRVHNLLRGEYFILSLLSVLGMMVMVSAHSMLTIYLGLEIMSLSLYTLIAIARDRAVAVEAAFKVFCAWCNCIRATTLRHVDDLWYYW